MWNIEEKRIEKIINLSAWQELVKGIKVSKHSVQSLAVTSDNEYLIAALSNQSIMVWDIQKNKKIPFLKIGFHYTHNAYNCKCLALMNDNQRFIASSDAKGLLVYNFQNHAAKEIIFDGHTKNITCIQIARDCRYAISAAEDLTIRIWDLQTKRQIYVLNIKDNSVSNLCMTSDCQYVAVFSIYKEIRIWSVREQELKMVFKNRDTELSSIALTRDRRFCVISNSVIFKVLKMKK